MTNIGGDKLKLKFLKRLKELKKDCDEMKSNRHGNAGMMTIFKVIWTAFQEDPRPRWNFRLSRNIETSSAYLAISTFHHQNCRNPKGVDWTCYYECTLELFVSTTNAFLLPLRPQKVYTPTTWFKRYSPCRNEWCGEGEGGRGRASCIGNSWSSKITLAQAFVLERTLQRQNTRNDRLCQPQSIN